MDELITSLPRLPHRSPDGHKGTFGKVAIVGGCAGRDVSDDEDTRARMIGAPALSAMGAVRAGCGLVAIGAPDPILSHALTIAPFATGLPIRVDEHNEIEPSDGARVVDELCASSDALVLGPGLGSGESIERLVARTLSKELFGKVRGFVVDADALNALSRLTDFAREVRVPCVLTPHPGEAERLLSALSIGGDPAGDDEQRRRACAALARRLGAVVVLKGARTMVSDSVRTWIDDTGAQPALATGGTGDVLSGVIGSLIAQGAGDGDLMLGACLGVKVHTTAGARWSAQHGAGSGLDPRELADEIPGAMGEIRRSYEFGA